MIMLFWFLSRQNCLNSGFQLTCQHHPFACFWGVKKLVFPSWNQVLFSRRLGERIALELNRRFYCSPGYFFLESNHVLTCACVLQSKQIAHVLSDGRHCAMLCSSSFRNSNTLRKYITSGKREITWFSEPGPPRICHFPDAETGIPAIFIRHKLNGALSLHRLSDWVCGKRWAGIGSIFLFDCTAYFRTPPYLVMFLAILLPGCVGEILEFFVDNFLSQEFQWSCLTYSSAFKEVIILKFEYLWGRQSSSLDELSSLTLWENC